MRQKLKAYRWWDSKLPPLLALAYFLLAHSSPPVSWLIALLSLVLFLLASIGIAGFAHLLNDVFDAGLDAANATENLAPRTSLRRAILLSALLLVALVPWVFLPLGAFGWSLIVCEFLLFAAYSIPPLRLKSRGVWGALADALYAHTIPVLVMWVTFAALSAVTAPLWFGVLVGVWSCAFGLRQILQHQLNDRIGDAAEHVQTFAVKYGYDATQRTSLLLLPVEFVTFVVLLVVLSGNVPWLAAAFALYLVWEFLKIRSLWLQPPNGSVRFARNGALYLWGLLWLNPFYERWLPLLLLLPLVLTLPDYCILALVHLVLFKNGLVDLIMEIPLVLKRRVLPLSV